MTETITVYSVEPDAIAPELTELEQLNLDVAAIAGWKDIKPWNTSRNQEVQPKNRLFVGKHDRKELGIHVPDYTSDLNAIVAVFGFEKLDWTLSSLGYAACGIIGIYAKSPAIALCKLLLELAPNLPKFEPEIQVIEDEPILD
jgi:hypothetical protein